MGVGSGHNEEQSILDGLMVSESARKTFLLITAVFVGSTAQLAAQNECLVLDGSPGTGAQVPDHPTLDLQAPFTIEAWVLPNDANLARIIAKADGSGPGTTVAYTFRRHHPSGPPGDAQAVIGYGDTNPTHVGTMNKAPAGEWHHWAVVVNSTEVQFYLDGVLEDSVTHNRQVRTTDTNLIIGRFPGYGQELNGNLDELRIWDHARTAAEINQTLYLQVEGPPGLISSWHFDGDMRDSTGSNHGWLEGNATFGASTSPIEDDTDGDGLGDVRESQVGTNPLDQDTDDDGLGDGDEYWGGITDPLAVDSDGDGIQDGTESGLDTIIWTGDPPNGIAGTDSQVFIPDADPATTTDPADADTDDDGLVDGTEDADWNGAVGALETDPDEGDSDGDWIGDGIESGIVTPHADTDPNVFVPDADPNTTTSPVARDTDGGGTTDGNEDLNRNGAVERNEGDPNDAQDDLFQLSILGLSPGQQATISVWDCRPGAVVVPLFSTTGQATRFFPEYQLELNLSWPWTPLQGMTADQNGNAFSFVWVPPWVPPGRTVYWQAVEVTAADAWRPSIPLVTQVQ